MLWHRLQLSDLLTSPLRTLRVYVCVYIDMRLGLHPLIKGRGVGTAGGGSHTTAGTATVTGVGRLLLVLLPLRFYFACFGKERRC